MTRTQEQLLALTRSGLWGEELDLSLFEAGVAWRELYHLAQQQTILGIVSTASQTLPAELRPKRSLMLQAHQALTLNRSARTHQIELLSQVIALLKRAGVERPVLLKGLGVAMNYPDPTLRTYGDLDIYVGDRLFDSCCDSLCAELDLTREPDNESEQHFAFEFHHTHIEIHRYASSPSGVAYRRKEFVAWCTEQLEGESLREVTIGNTALYLPPYDFDFIYIFYHSWRHLLKGGVGLRQLCDWCCLIDQLSEKFDNEQITQIATRFRLTTPISIFSTLAVEHLGLDQRKLPHYCPIQESILRKTLDKIWEGGNFGLYRKERQTHKSTLLGLKMQSLEVMLSDLRYVLRVDPAYALRFYRTQFAISIKHALGQFNQLGKRV